MSDMKGIIALEGELVTIYKKTLGVEDAHGDPAVTWTAESKQEKVWIQDTISASSPATVRTLAGEVETSKYIGYLLPDTVIVTGAILEGDGRRIKVGKIQDAKMFGVLSHKEAHLMLMEIIAKQHTKTFTGDAVLVVP